MFEEIVKTPKGCKVYYKFKAWLHLPKQKWIWRNEGSLFERRRLIQKKTKGRGWKRLRFNEKGFFGEKAKTKSFYFELTFI